ncbi:hypothetical protein K488DRAFT_67716 [Vararia minispora EC-137]|uniref:Uncharacterized protein n=1 Tax=Vararia minispora EC-137 TaxID=1314806 RepID=A0ACB8QXG6_9AGAM|nr:hypothetical protein K488DRAFT_67716 [Vararia minispora EC-137]
MAILSRPWIILTTALAFTRENAALRSACSFPLLPFPPSAADIASFISSRFDVIVIVDIAFDQGGGTAGLAVASRLAENPDVTIGVLEAGRFHLNDPIIDIPRFSGRGAGNPDYDWAFTTTPQANADDRNFSITRGKVLGGSSGLNLMVWGRASTPEYDAWEQLGSPDWSFQSLLPFFKRSENISGVSNPYPGISNPAQRPPAIFNGFTGPVQAGHNSFYPQIVFAFAETLNNTGVGPVAFPQDGNAKGTANVDLSVGHATGMRSYAAKAYYCNQPAKRNLKILTGVQLVATGVWFSAGSQIHLIRAKKQVVLSAGTVLTPQILELSGIGNRSILSHYGIPVLLDLPQVGENLQASIMRLICQTRELIIIQEHLYSFSEYQLASGQVTYDLLQSNQTFAMEQLALYNATGTGFWANPDSTAAFVTLPGLVNTTRQAQLLALLDEEIGAARAGTLTKAQLQMQRGYFVSNDIPAVELFQWSMAFANNAPPNTSFITVLAGIMHPVSRGSVHIVSSDPLAKPALDPGFLTSKFDQQLLVDVMRLATGLGNVSPLHDKVAAIASPPSASLSDADLLAYIKQTCANGGHLIGTAPMSPQELGGVVDHTLKVYGTRNLRVVDASIIPLHIAAHTQATAAEMIAADLQQIDASMDAHCDSKHRYPIGLATGINSSTSTTAPLSKLEIITRTSDTIAPWKPIGRFRRRSCTSALLRGPRKEYAVPGKTTTRQSQISTGKREACTANTERDDSSSGIDGARTWRYIVKVRSKYKRRDSVRLLEMLFAITSFASEDALFDVSQQGDVESTGDVREPRKR